MIFTMLPSPPPSTERKEFQFQPSQFHFAPSVSSPLSSSPIRQSSASPSPEPLSPRHENVPGKSATIHEVMKSPTPASRYTPKDRESNGSTNVPFSRRVAKFNPLIHGRDETRETRRQLFLKRVRETAEEKKWAARGGDDELMRLVWMAEQRRRMEEHSLAASLDPSFEEEDEMDIPACSDVVEEAELADEFAMQEDAEIDAYLDSVDLPLHAATSHEINYTAQISSQPQHFGSDDEDYDSIFMDVIRDEERAMSSQSMDAQLSTNDTLDHDMMEF